MGLFANRWRALREATSTEVASSAVQHQQEQASERATVRVRKTGKLLHLEAQQDVRT